MSCRALGRGAEDAFLTTLATDAAQAGAMLRGEFIPTKKNDPARQFLRRLNLEPQDMENGPFQFAIEPNQVAVPPWITIDERSAVR
jgi:predicted enzyme involved in methoxymalonyl-ACP biosynthesis